jgi:hypothetical protein
MITKAIDDIVKADIDSLIENGVQENLRLEYKKELPANTDAAKKEFLADVAAFANVSGGDILFGVDELRDESGKTTGIPGSTVGLMGNNQDDMTRQLENIIRDGLAPRINGVRFKLIEGFDGRSVLVLRIPRSWSAPHAVTFKGSSRFYARNSAGKYQLDVAEIRAAFVLSQSIPEQIRHLRNERLGRIDANDTPVVLRQEAKTVLHIVPVSALQLGNQINLAKVEHHWPQIKLINTGGSNFRYNLDGLLIYDNSAGIPNEGYVQVFRSGTIEAVDAFMLRVRNGKRNIPGVSFENRILESLVRYMNLLGAWEIPGPYLIMLSLLGVRGYQMASPREAYLTAATPHSIDRDALILPEIMLEDYTQPVDQQLRTLMDTIWQSAGWARSPYYDEMGKRVQP